MDDKIAEMMSIWQEKLIKCFILEFWLYFYRKNPTHNSM
ncbi:conserved hypothetical protein [Vibrio aestuarianus]|nr:conserved hypothetical protein [Vibrio aestuarianus subsp. francensis]CAH8203805.1 conserved hypothetical protein [Vibrio aestuarianus]CAH8203874.1 conserved hypothetical protein [Vibrio aestuarianus]CAH8215913.1 conserved hypothetical protein [Vibrio aestuarianus]